LAPSRSDDRSRSTGRGRKVRAPQGRVPGNAWGARAHGKCNRKYTARPLSSGQVRVKWCGKSAPRGWQQTRHGKPHPEQDQIGIHGCGPQRIRVGRYRQVVTPVADEWSSSTEPGLSTGLTPVADEWSSSTEPGLSTGSLLLSARPVPPAVAGWPCSHPRHRSLRNLICLMLLSVGPSNNKIYFKLKWILNIAVYGAVLMYLFVPGTPVAAAPEHPKPPLID